MSVNKKRKEVEEKIRDWLLEEGIKINLIPNEHASFNCVAEDKEGRKVNVVQPIKKIDQILIINRAVLAEKQQEKLMRWKLDPETVFSGLYVLVL